MMYRGGDLIPKGKLARETLENSRICTREYKSKGNKALLVLVL